MDAPERPAPALPLLLAWLVPGAGHAVLRKPWPALFVAASILPLFGTGLVLGGFEIVSWERHPWLFSLQVLTGAPAGVAALLTRTVVPTDPLSFRTVGELFTCVAGLLNVVAMADVWARCRSGDPESRLVEPAEEDHEGGAESLLAPETPAAPAAPPADSGPAGAEPAPEASHG
jgi:uncharacterized protein DUF6677